MLKHVFYSKMLRGVLIAREAPVITHLFFAGDNIIFTQANVQEATSISNIL